MVDEDEMDLSVVEIAGKGAAKWLEKLPLGPAKAQIGELIGDSVRLWRLKNLGRIMGEVDRVAESRGLGVDQVQALSLHVGLPWIDKASLCEDDDIQKRWAELFLSLGTEPHPKYSAGATYVRILAELDPWDCAVLDYMVREGGLSKSLFREVLFWEELMGAMVAPEDDPSRTLLSIEKLVRCGCLEVRDVHTSRDDNGISIYGGIQRRVSLTVTGLKFHIAVTGDEPGWLRKDDENRDDIHPVNPLPRDQRKGVSSIPEQDRFVRLVSDFDAIHYRLLDESKGDSRTVRDTIRSIDGAPEAAIVVEGRNPHPVLPGERAWLELYENGLVNLANPETIMTKDAYKLGSLTPLGVRFLEFIEDRKTPSGFVQPANG